MAPPTSPRKAASRSSSPFKALQPTTLANRRQLQWTQALEEKEFRDELHEPAENSIFYDGSAPSTVERRQRARADFEHFVKAIYGHTDPETVYHPDTITDFVCRFLEGYAKMAKGKLKEEIKAGTLYETKRALQWWLNILIPGFPAIASSYHGHVNRHIHMVATKFELSQEAREKNLLTSSELDLFYQQIMHEIRRIPAWKHCYAAFLLAYMTAVRPGSFVVTKGYTSGTRLGGAGGAGMKRAETHTLFWKDVSWLRMRNGIACKITFRYSKGHQDPYRQQYIEGARSVFLPPKSRRLHLDLSAVLFCIAYERGVFKKPLEEILNGNEKIIATNARVCQEAVFVGADTQGEFIELRTNSVANILGALITSKVMSSGALNRKLKELCRLVGLLSHYTLYSFRRAAASETIDRHSLEEAQKLLGHDVGSTVTLRHYDPVGQGRLDLTHYRLGGVGGLASEEIERYFRPSNTDRYVDPSSLKEEMAERLKVKLDGDLEFQETEHHLNDKLHTLHQSLQGLGLIDEEEVFVFGRMTMKRLTDLLKGAEAAAFKEQLSGKLEDLEKFLAHRKTRRRDIKIKLKREILQELRQELKDVATISGDDSGEDESGEDGSPDETRRAATEAANRASYETAQEPDEWRDLEEGATVMIADDEVEEVAEDEDDEVDRNQWIRTFIKKVIRRCCR